MAKAAFWCSILFCIGALQLLYGVEHTGPQVEAEREKAGTTRRQPGSTQADDSISNPSKKDFGVKAVALFALGQSQQNRGQLVQALASYRKAREEDPAYGPTYLCEAEALYQLKRVEEAIALLEGNEKIAGGKAEFDLLLALGYLEENSLSQAHQRLNRALASLSKKPNQGGSDAGYYLRMGGMIEYLFAGLEPFEMQKRLNAARPLYLKAESLEPRNPLIYIRLAELATLTNDRAGMLQAYKKAYAAAPDYPGLRERLSAALLLANQPREAIPLLEEIARNDPTRPRIHAALGELYSELGEYAKAEDAYLLALRIDSSAWSTPQACIRLALAQLAQDKTMQARSLLLEADRRFHQDAKVALLAAFASRRLKKFEESIGWFKRAEERGRRAADFVNSPFYAEYGATLEMKGDIPGAARLFEKAIALDPKNHKAMNYLAYMWVEKGMELEKAQSLLEKAVALDPNNAAYEDSFGWLYYQKKDYTQAKMWIEKALKQAGDDPVVNDHMGDIFFALKDSEKALQHWQKALNQKHEKPETVQKKIDALKKERKESNTP